MTQAQQASDELTQEEIDALYDRGYTLPEPVRWLDHKSNEDIFNELAEVMNFMSLDCTLEDCYSRFIDDLTEELTWGAPDGYVFTTVEDARGGGEFKYVKIA